MLQDHEGLEQQCLLVYQGLGISLTAQHTAYLQLRLAYLQGPTVCRLHDQEKERSQWEKERQALEEQVACVRAEWQSKWDKAVSDIQSHQQATAHTADQLLQCLPLLPDQQSLE